MIQLLINVPLEVQPTLVDIINPPIQIEEPIKEITWQDNPNNCDQTTQWIASEKPFYCIDKPISSISSLNSKKAIVAPANSSGNTYSYGYCTWYVKNQLSRVNNGWHNAYQWSYYAKLDGFGVYNSPIVNSVAVKGNHVAVVTAVNGDQMTISEMNYKGWNIQSSRTIPITGWQFIY